MKKLLFVLLVLLMAVPAYASVAVQDNGTYEGEATAINFSTGNAVSFDGSTATVTGNGSPTYTTMTATNVIGTTQVRTASLYSTAGVTAAGDIAGANITATASITTGTMAKITATASHTLASGATAGTIKLISNANANDNCAASAASASAGTSYVLCVSNGTNWLAL
jgi:hypothetical protein